MKDQDCGTGAVIVQREDEFMHAWLLLLTTLQCRMSMSNMLEMLKPQPRLCRKVHRRDSLARVCETAGRYNKKKCPEKGSMHRKYGQEENREKIIVQRNGMKPQRVEDE